MCSLLQKQSDILLNADDLDAMWVCLRENCVIDDATGAEKVFWNCSVNMFICFKVIVMLTYSLLCHIVDELRRFLPHSLSMYRTNRPQMPTIL